MFEGEGLELPLLTGSLIHEVQNPGRRLGLYTSSADGTNPQLAGFGLKEEPSGFWIFSDMSETSALVKTGDASTVRLDLMQRVEPELSLSLAALETEDLLRLVLTDGEGGKLRGW